jgi:hypothetical protein
MADTMLVFSAHAADFVWRWRRDALYATREVGACVSCASRMASAGKARAPGSSPGMTVERVKDIRRAESERAAAALGADALSDAGDYPLRAGDADRRLVKEYRTLGPAIVLTHSHHAIPTIRIIRKQAGFRWMRASSPRRKAIRCPAPRSARRAGVHVRAVQARAVRVQT